MKKMSIKAKFGKAEGELVFPVPEEMETHMQILRDNLFNALCDNKQPNGEETFVVKRTNRNVKFSINIYNFDIEL